MTTVEADEHRAVGTEAKTAPAHRPHQASGLAGPSGRRTVARRSFQVLGGVLTAALLTACSSSGSGVPAAVGSAARSAGISAAGSAATSAVSALQSAVAAASSAAASQLAAVKNGVDARSDVSVGAAATDADGRATAVVTVTNHGSGTADYTVAVSFRDPGGNLLDAVVVSVDAVNSGASRTATARSNRTLSGSVSAEIAAALRH